MLLFLDYADYGQGIFADLFGAEAARAYVELRTAKRFDEARELSAGCWRSRPRAAAVLFERRYVQAVCRAVRRPAGARLPDLRQRRRPRGCGSNTSSPGITSWTAARSSWTDGRFGFVGRGAEIGLPDAERDARGGVPGQARGGREVDVLCTHIPPAVPELLYDTVARRLEKGSVALLETIKATRPRYSHLRARAPAAGPPDQDRRHGMPERGPLPRHGRALCPAVVAVRSRVGGVRCRNHRR